MTVACPHDGCKKSFETEASMKGHASSVHGGLPDNYGDTTDMTESDSGTETGVQDGHKEDEIGVAWLGGSKYVVWSDSGSAYNVDLSDGPSCNCEHGTHNRNGTDACWHIREAIKSHHDEPDLEHSIVLEMAQSMATLREVADAAGTTSTTQPTTDGANSSDGGTDDIVSDCEAWLETTGVDTSDVRVEYNEEFDSLNIHCESDDVDGWSDLTTGYINDMDDSWWVGDDRMWIITSDDFDVIRGGA